MRKVAVFSLLLIAGMVGAQLLPGLAGDVYVELIHGLRLATMGSVLKVSCQGESLS